MNSIIVRPPWLNIHKLLLTTIYVDLTGDGELE